MKYDEIRQTITASSPDDWAVIVVNGMTFLDQFGQVSSGAGDHWLETSSHVYLAAYKADIDLRLAWGLSTDRGLTFDGFSFADPLIERHLVDGFWRGSLVTRWSVLSVDGHRCYLPEPHAVMVETGESTFGYEAAGERVKASEVALARLLQGLSQPGGLEFNDYLKRTGAVITPSQ